ncbi:MAG: hypothetical protein EHM67_06460 [Hyphomicrobiaceae bacterium]|jgi:hypothetical protein|nr:MAG: hypothetical protein EHM67_06460 [Hyphomicrobiaceae bacterium]
MKIRLQLFSKDLEPVFNRLRHTVDVPVTADDDVDDVICTALTKLLRHTWSLAPGDCIRINEI